MCSLFPDTAWCVGQTFRRITRPQPLLEDRQLHRKTLSTIRETLAQRPIECGTIIPMDAYNFLLFVLDGFESGFFAPAFFAIIVTLFLAVAFSDGNLRHPKTHASRRAARRRKHWLYIAAAAVCSSLICLVLIRLKLDVRLAIATCAAGFAALAVVATARRKRRHTHSRTDTGAIEGVSQVLAKHVGHYANKPSRYPLSAQISSKSASSPDLEPSSSGSRNAGREDTAWRSIAGVVDLKQLDIVL